MQSTLAVAATHRNDTNGLPALPLRLLGDGMLQSVLQAATPGMDAILRFAGTTAEGDGKTLVLPGHSADGHSIESLGFDANGLANYSVAAVAITRSQVRFSKFSGALVPHRQPRIPRVKCAQPAQLRQDSRRGQVGW